MTEGMGHGLMWAPHHWRSMNQFLKDSTLSICGRLFSLWIDMTSLAWSKMVHETTWARAGRTSLPVLSRNPLQSPIAYTSRTEGTRSHSSTPILWTLKKLLKVLGQNMMHEYGISICLHPHCMYSHTQKLWKMAIQPLMMAHRHDIWSHQFIIPSTRWLRKWQWLDKWWCTNSGRPY